MAAENAHVSSGAPPRGGLLLLISEFQTLQEVATDDGGTPAVAPPAPDDLELLECFGLISRDENTYAVTARGRRLLAASPTYQTSVFYRFEVGDLQG
ncbi:hypothetical protein [Planctomyces sp. SH-PL14]|uniref:hypothetical protein n=1 Tax=Planctomyces sp. SH-PL14 TaxID=1632864 RepID=UPI00078BA7F7|nr:hypothetical protein [Planctomyces sp. SH-PL14]AMV19568.1 hypothetical protein VT03_16860 [Planctomyces sp. SH-PL14]